MSYKIKPPYTEKERDLILSRMKYRVIGLLTLAFICYLVCATFYHETLIKPYIIGGILFIPSLILTFFTTEIWFRFIYSKYFFVRFLGNTIIIGGVFSALLLSINSAFVVGDLRFYKFKINDKYLVKSGHKWKRSPSCFINYFGQEKELVFSENDYDLVQHADSVSIAVCNGRLGFDVIKEIYLIQNPEDVDVNTINQIHE